MTETYRVQLNRKTARLLGNLKAAFEGGRAITPDLHERDDVVIAREFGWKLRQIEGDWRPFGVQILEEYLRRLDEAIATGDVVVTPRHVLTATGIDSNTLSEIDRRVTRVQEIVEYLSISADLDLSLASLTDEELIDLDTWARLRRLNHKAPVEEARTNYFRWEIQARAKYREEHKLTASPRVPVHRGYTPLTALERAQFLRNWRKTMPEVENWSDEAILAGLFAGM